MKTTFWLIDMLVYLSIFIGLYGFIDQQGFIAGVFFFIIGGMMYILFQSAKLHEIKNKKK